jgi:hypothetical protein
VIARYKHSSLFGLVVSDEGKKSLTTWTPECSGEIFGQLLPALEVVPDRVEERTRRPHVTDWAPRTSAKNFCIFSLNFEKKKFIFKYKPNRHSTLAIGDYAALLG